MKKVLIFSLMYYPRVGGAEVAIKEITDRIDPSDIEFHMVTVGADSTLPVVEQIGHVLVHRIGFFKKKNPIIADFSSFPLKLNKWLFQFFACVKAFKLHRQYSYDAIWAMMAHSSGVPATLFKGKYPNIPYLLTLQEGDPPEYIERKMRMLWPWFVQAFKKADVIQVISTFLGRWARKRGFKGQLEVIPNGVEIVLFSREFSEDELNRTRHEVGKREEDIFLVTASRLVKKNATKDIISALAHLPKQVHFLILGTGPNEEKLRKLAKKIGVENRVKFLGHIDHNDLPKYLKISDIFIRPSLSEGMGNSFIEAMAVGIPVIATAVGGIPDFLKHEKTGLFCEVENPKSIAEQAERLIGQEKLRNQIISNAKKMIEEKYDWNLISKDMKEKVFDRLLKS